MKKLWLLFIVLFSLSAQAQDSNITSPRYARSRVMNRANKNNAIANAKKRTERTIAPLNDVSRDTVGATELHQLDVTGKGVVLCVVDCGIDFNHDAFTDSTGISHVKRAMIYSENPNDTLWNESHTEWRWNYVYAQSPEEIKALTTDYDLDTHGTHTSNSAGGARHATGSENSEYYGMAPDAELFLVGNPSLSTEYTLDAFHHAQQYAMSVGKPLVCSYSIGDILTPLDTLEYWPRALREFTEDGNAEGIAVCVSSGNSGSTSNKLSVHWDFTNEDAMRKHKTVLGYESIEDNKCFYNGCYYMFYDINGHDFQYNLSIVDAIEDSILWQSEWFSTTTEIEADIIEDTPFAKYGQLIISGGIDPDNHLKCAYVMSDDLTLPYIVNDDQQPIDSCYVLVFTVVGEHGGHIEGKSYPGSQYGEGFHSGTSQMTGYEEGDALNAINSYSSNPWCISVGASDAREGNGGCAFFTSYGYDFYGNSYPHVLAPGVNIMSAYSRYYYNPDDLDIHPYETITGTSMSTPITAGVIACWMQENPKLTTRQIHDIIAKTSYIGPVLAESAIDAIQYGFGTLQGKAGWDMVRALNPTALFNIKASAMSESTKTYTLNGVETKANNGLLIKNGKKVFIK